MPGLLEHSPADVLRRALIAVNLGADPPATPWPAYTSAEPASPDNVLTCYDTADATGERDGWGDRSEFHGVQVRVRAATFAVGWTKANAISIAMDKTLVRLLVTMPGGAKYLLEAVTRTSGVLDLGTDGSTTKRRLFTINALVTVRRSTA
jgi:hypothetical protein